ncbi:unnamed protein product [Leptosia nina]|uniref:Uncharacterized protein n=1 Tax=Leptosia nina TaxID=320188 RepID=A0AAV1JWQ0_9NEOP
MKFALVFSAILVLAAAETYSPDNDNLDIEKVVSDNAVFLQFMNCFIDKGECNEITSDFKKDIPEALEQACLKCTEPQKHIFKRFLEEAKVKIPQEYAVFLKKYDPESKYIAPLQTAIAGF